MSLNVHLSLHSKWPTQEVGQLKVMGDLIHQYKSNRITICNLQSLFYSVEG